MSSRYWRKCRILLSHEHIEAQRDQLDLQRRRWSRIASFHEASNGEYDGAARLVGSRRAE